MRMVEMGVVGLRAAYPASWEMKALPTPPTPDWGGQLEGLNCTVVGVPMIATWIVDMAIIFEVICLGKLVVSRERLAL